MLQKSILKQKIIFKITLYSAMINPYLITFLNLPEWEVDFRLLYYVYKTDSFWPH